MSPRSRPKVSIGFSSPLRASMVLASSPSAMTAPPSGTSWAKPAEGVLHVLQILEKVQVVRVHIQNHRHSGEKGEEGVAVLTGLQNDGVPLPHPVSRPQGGEGPPDHHRGVPLGGQKIWVHMEVVVVFPWVPATHRAFW